MDNFPFDIEAFFKEAEEWARVAAECVCCRGIAKLENGLCSHCRTKPHKHPAITIIVT